MFQLLLCYDGHSFLPGGVTPVEVQLQLGKVAPRREGSPVLLEI